MGGREFGSAIEAASSREPDPPLPPSPMAEPASQPVPDVRLPADTFLWTTAAGLLAGLVVVPIDSLWGGWRLEVDEACGLGAAATVSGFLLGAGLVLADRYVPGRPRAMRWALGMALRGLIPLWLVVAQSQGYGMQGSNLRIATQGEMLASALGSAVLGLVLALSSRSGKGLLWKMPLAGAAAGLGGGIAAILFIGVWGFTTAGAFADVTGPGAALLRPVSGALIGLVLAHRLAVGGRQQERAEQEELSRRLAQ